MFSRRKPSSRSSAEGARGYTLLELLLTMTMMLLGGLVAFSVAFGARRLYDADAARVELNQDLRAALDMVVTEARLTGGRLTADFPAIELVDDPTGDRLTLRRHLAEPVLVSCLDLAASDSRVYVGLTAGAGACAILPDNDADGYPDNVQEYREYRLAHGAGAPPVLANGFVYDPSTRAGEWVTLENEVWDSGPGRWYLQLGTGLAGAYPAANQPRVYLLDETRYRVTAGTLELQRDGDPTGLAVIDGVSDFQVALLMQDSSLRTTFTSADDWTLVETLQLDLSGERTVRDRTLTRTVASDVLPRNVLSH